jgi:hypothetical protein
MRTYLIALAAALSLVAFAAASAHGGGSGGGWQWRRWTRTGWCGSARWPHRPKHHRIPRAQPETVAGDSPFCCSLDAPVRCQRP